MEQCIPRCRKALDELEASMVSQLAPHEYASELWLIVILNEVQRFTAWMEVSMNCVHIRFRFRFRAKVRFHVTECNLGRD